MSIADQIKNGISRRGFVLGGAAAGAATVLAGCSKKTGTSDDAAGEPQVIKDDSKIVSITDEYEAVDIDLEPAASWTLPLGTLLYYCDGDYAAAMMAPASALHANTLGVLILALAGAFAHEQYLGVLGTLTEHHVRPRFAQPTAAAGKALSLECFPFHISLNLSQTK